MNCSCDSKTKRLIQSLLGVVLAVAIFGLPLHSHAFNRPEGSNECSCYQGSRTQLGLLSADPDCTPRFDVFSVAIDLELTIRAARTELRDARAPPLVS
jgi:hypothetical protein